MSGRGTKKRAGKIAKCNRKRTRSSVDGSGNVCEPVAVAGDMSRKAVISVYHQKQKQLSAALRGERRYASEAARVAHLNLLRAQLRVIGLESYQEASLAGEQLGAGFDSSQWVMDELKTRVDDHDDVLRLLDVGAIVHRFPEAIELNSGRRALEATAIDLNPNDARVLKADFFEYAAQCVRENATRFDIVALCLCVNFVGCTRRRGEMLRLAARISAIDAFLFLTLPRACVDNSRYMDIGSLEKILNAVGWTLVSQQYSAKLILVICKRSQDVAKESVLIRKQIVRKGAQHNNFSIEVDQGEVATMGAKNERNGGVKKSSGGGGQQGARSKNKSHSVGGLDKPSTSNQRKRARRKAKRKVHQA